LVYDITFFLKPFSRVCLILTYTKSQLTLTVELRRQTIVCAVLFSALTPHCQYSIPKYCTFLLRAVFASMILPHVSFSQLTAVTAEEFDISPVDLLLTEVRPWCDSQIYSLVTASLWTRSPGIDCEFTSGWQSFQWLKYVYIWIVL